MSAPDGEAEFPRTDAVVLPRAPRDSVKVPKDTAFCAFR